MTNQNRDEKNPQHISLKPGTLLAPVPVVLVSTQGFDPETGEQRDNLTTIAWTGIVNSDPPMVSLSVRPSRLAHDFITANGRFAINLVSEELARACDYCGVRSGRDHNKFRDLHLRSFELDSGLAGLERSPLVLDCKVSSSEELGSHTLFLAVVEDVRVRPDLLDKKGKIHMGRARLINYIHGDYYATGDMLGFFGFSVARPEVLKRRMPTKRVNDKSSQKTDAKPPKKNQKKRRPN